MWTIAASNAQDMSQRAYLIVMTKETRHLLNVLDSNTGGFGSLYPLQPVSAWLFPSFNSYRGGGVVCFIALGSARKATEAENTNISG